MHLRLINSLSPLALWVAPLFVVPPAFAQVTPPSAQVAPAAEAPAAAPEVPQWGRFEVAVKNPRPYADPYSDVQLNVVYTAPGGKEIAFWGFYDGGETWRLRFMPHLRGRWQYRATFSDGGPGLSGEFRVIYSDIPGMLSVNMGNPMWFSGDVIPVLIRGLHVGDRFFAGNWPAEKRRAFLDWAGAQGYNFLSIASHYLNRDVEGRGRGWETPRLWPLAAGEFSKLEPMLDDLAARRIYAYPFAGFFGQKSSFPETPVEQERFVRYALARLGPYWNIILNVAGPEPNLREDWMSESNVQRLGRMIRSLDVFGHPLSVHNETGDDPYRDSDWTTYGTLQGPKTLSRAELGAGLLRNHHPAKPLLAQETLWPGNKYHPAYTDDDLRKSAYVIQMSAAALVYGDFAGDSSTGFSGTMDMADLQPRRHAIVKQVWDFISTIPYFDMQPRQDLVSQGYCLAALGRHYLVYLESGGTTDVRVEDGPFVVTWINARDTADRRPGGTTETGADLRAPDGGDWLLYLTRTNTALADQIHLSWQKAPSSSFTATWHTLSQENPAVLEYRRPDSPEWIAVRGETLKSPGAGWLHRATAEALSPHTAYEYRVSNDRSTTPAMSRVYTTRTAPLAGSPFSAAFVADTGLVGRIDGNTTGTQRVIDAVRRAQPLFVLGGGDYGYANRDLRFGNVGNTADEWFNQWQPLIARAPFMAQYGNHEDHLLEQYTDWRDRFAHPPGHDDGKDYSFEVAGVHFVALYVPGKGIPASRLEWLDRDLAAARARGVRWIVVFQHEPIYAHGRSHPAIPEVREKIAPILERHAVDIHLSTHDQNYERTLPLSGVPHNLQVRSKSLHRYRQGEGVLYVKVSPGGKKSEIGNEFSRFTVPKQPFMAVRESGFHHYALIGVNRSGELNVQAFRLPDRAGEPSLLDAFVIEPRQP